jgi:hypothetical protein
MAACALGPVNHGNFLKIQEGMTQLEVNSILGEPSEVMSADFGPLGGSHVTWNSGNATVMVQFVNGRVKAKQYITH